MVQLDFCCIVQISPPDWRISKDEMSKPMIPDFEIACNESGGNSHSHNLLLKIDNKVDDHVPSLVELGVSSTSW